VSPARWIALEGGEGSGKSSQARRLAATVDAVLTREPGGTPVGSRIREVLLNPDVAGLDPRAEALLMAADRAQHLAEVVRPALASGRSVVSDRSVWSSLAYQGYGRGLELSIVRQLSDWAMEGRWPDVVVLLDVPRDVAAEWLVAAGRVPDRLEAAGDEFHGRVASGFRELARAHPETWVVVDGVGDEAVVAGRVLTAVEGRLGPSVG
jgi:dTMP kinase